MATDEMAISDPWRKSFSDQVKSFGDLKNDDNLKQLLEFIYFGKIYGSFWDDYRTLGIPKEKIFERIRQSNRSIKDIISILLDEYRYKTGKSRVGVKYPMHFSKVNILINWYPDCKIVFLTRDPRAICASKIWDEATKARKKKYKIFKFFIHYITICFFIKEYIWSSKIFQKYRDHNNLLGIRYEDLISNTEYCLKKICHFCEIPYEKKMMAADGKPSSFTSGTKNALDKQRISNWQNKLSRFDKWLITILTKKSMEKLDC